MKPLILVLGSDGFIGAEVSRALQGSDWDLRIDGLHRFGATAAPAPERRAVEVTRSASVRDALSGVSAVVNCITGNAETIVKNAEALVAATANLAPSPRLIHLSSMTVYGSAEGLLDESAPLLGDVGPYSAAKVAAERILATYPRTVILRPGVEYGPRGEQWSGNIARLLLAHRLGDLGPAGDGCCNLVHVADVAAAVVRALGNPATDGGVFNLSMAGAPTWNEYLTRFAIALRAVPVSRLSARRLKIEAKLLAPPLKLAAMLGRAVRVPAGWLPPFIPPSALPVMAQDIRLDSRAAETVLGQTWRHLEASLAETAAWFALSRSSA